jgi:hypothetical protein
MEMLRLKAIRLSGHHLAYEGLPTRVLHSMFGALGKVKGHPLLGLSRNFGTTDSVQQDQAQSKNCALNDQ